MARPARVSPDRILAAAALEFAERGFGGARVDRIARRARVNKAMLYYHFRSKQELYRALIRQTFSEAAERVRAIAAEAASPADKLNRVVAGMAEFIRSREYFSAIWLREVAEGGAHLDTRTLQALAAVPRAFFTIVDEGVSQRVFRPMHPVFAYFMTIAPVVLFLGARRIRQEATERHVMNLTALAPEEFIAELQEACRRLLAATPDSPRRTTL
jgi:TetR/AcrR family transcriptional regulator